jgi:hypothetical protein
MRSEETLQDIEFTTEKLPMGVSFNSDLVSLNGLYTDEVSLFRAKKVWRTVFEGAFLLDSGSDFVLEHKSSIDKGYFALTCSFKSACGRYAFWRLINNQSPEAQYMIETAHIPSCESRRDDFLSAPDMVDVASKNNEQSASLIQWLVNVLGRRDSR